MGCYNVVINKLKLGFKKRGQDEAHKKHAGESKQTFTSVFL